MPRHPDVAIFQVNRIGDQLLALPAVRAVCARFPGGVRLLLGEGMLSFFYQGLPITGVTRVWWKDYEAELLDVERPSGACDLFVSLSRRAGVSTLADRMGASRRVGLFEDTVVVPRRHAFETLFSAATAVDDSLQFDDFCGSPVVSSAAANAAAALVAAWRRPGGRLLFVHPETRPEKMWASSKFSDVLGRFLEHHPTYNAIVSTVDPVDYHLPAHRVHYSTHHLELSIAVLRHVDLFLGVDSCFLHAADLWRVPGVALFGPTDPHTWGFRLSPIAHHVCAEKMDLIEPATVLAALKDAEAARERRDRPPGR